MAICIISIYKIARKMGGDLSLSALVMCGISALIINFMAIQTNPFLTKAYYYILGSMIIFAASGVTCYNKYLLYRHNQPAAHGAIHDSMNIAADDAIAESEERAEEKPAEDMLFSSAEEPASNEAETDAQPALGESAPAEAMADEQPATSEPSSAEVITDERTASDKLVPAEAVTGEQPATSEPASTEAVTEAEPAAETLTDDAQASKAASPISETEPKPEATGTAKAAETFEPEKAMLKAAEHIASAKEAEAEPISDTLEKAETEPVIESKAKAAPAQTADKAAPAVQKNEAIPEGKPAAEAEAVDANAESISKAPNSSDAESESGTDADIADSETAPAMPETGQKDAPQQEPAKAVLPDGLESMDDLLDFAFAQASAEHYAMALLAYSTALEKYRNDDYAPFIIIDMVNLYKSQGQYQAAIDCINEAMDIPAIKANPAYQQNFQNYLAQIESISHSAASPKVP